MLANETGKNDPADKNTMLKACLASPGGAVMAPGSQTGYAASGAGELCCPLPDGTPHSRQPVCQAGLSGESAPSTPARMQQVMQHQAATSVLQEGTPSVSPFRGAPTEPV